MSETTGRKFLRLKRYLQLQKRNLVTKMKRAQKKKCADVHEQREGSGTQAALQ